MMKLLLMLVLLWPVAGLADCVKDSHGEVYCGAGYCARAQDGTLWCSRFKAGGAQVTREGVVVCGKGQCAKTFSGDLYCSSVDGGAALKDCDGRVRCQGRFRAVRTRHP